MKPFDLEKALAGEPVRCRDESYKVLRIVHVPEVTDESERLIAIIEVADKIVASLRYEDGSVPGFCEHWLDLFMATKKRTVYLNVYKWPGDSLINGRIYEYEDDATSDAESYRQRGMILHTIAMPHEIEE